MPRSFFGKNKEYIGNDEFYTQEEDWKAIKEFIPLDKVIWAPFYADGKQKEYFKNMGIDIIHEKEDFFLNNKGNIVIDNPPFSKKRKIIERLKELNKPFILIMPSEILTYKYIKKFGDDLQIIIPKNRMNFLRPNKSLKKFNYDCIYFCWKMNLHKDIIFLN